MHEALIPTDQVDDFIILRARAFTTKVQRTMAREILKDENLPLLEWQVLFSIARFGSCHLAYVTRQTTIDPAHGSRAVSELEKKELISRYEDPTNKKRKLISLTSKGKEKFDRIWPKAKNAMTAMTNRLNPDELNELKRLLDLLNGSDTANFTHDLKPTREDKKIESYTYRDASSDAETV